MSNTVDYTVGEGMTSVIDFVLKTIDRDTNAETAYDASGDTTVTMYLDPLAGATVKSVSTADRLSHVTSGSDPAIRFSPNSTDFALSDFEYKCHFVVLHSDGTDDRFPSDSNLVIQVIDTKT